MKILIVADYFLPGHLAGGPIRTLENLRDITKDEIVTHIFTRDRDLGMKTSYHNRKSNTWYNDKKGKVYYADGFFFGPVGLSKVLRNENYDLIYLNSFFSLFGSIMMMLYLKFLRPDIPILLAPRGELSVGALSLKHKKKRAFLQIAKLLGIYTKISWHASTDLEKIDIQNCFPNVADKILVAPDPVVMDEEIAGSIDVPKVPGILNIAFVSRISPMKNLDGLLLFLQNVKSSITLNVYGPIEDEAYWAKCNALVAQLPSNVNYVYHGSVHPELVSTVIADHHVFVLPTHGENFGHVIFESLRAGTPVIISNNTSWREDEMGAIETIATTDIEGWSQAIDRIASYTQETLQLKRSAARAYALKYSSSSNARENTISLFEGASR